jgi:hypothetical protein
MDKLEHYRACIQTLLEKHSQYKSREEDVESQLFFDTVRELPTHASGLERLKAGLLHRPAL